MSEWHDLVLERLEASKNWDMSKRQNRREVRQIKRRLFWAKWGTFRAVVVGAVVGLTIGLGSWHYVIAPMMGVA